MIIEIPDEQKEATLDAINHGGVLLSKIRNTFFFCCELPREWVEWQERNNYNADDAIKRLDKEIAILHNLFNQIENKEKNNG